MNHFPDATHDKPLATGHKPLATHSLRVLMITGIFPPDIGGPATYVPTMSSELVKRGHKVTVVTLSDSLVDHDDRSYNFPVHRIRRVDDVEETQSVLQDCVHLHSESEKWRTPVPSE